MEQKQPLPVESAYPAGAPGQRAGQRGPLLLVLGIVLAACVLSLACAACGLVAGHVVALVWSYRCVRRRVAHVTIQPQLSGQLVATALFLLCFLALARTGVWVAATISALAYVSSVAASQLRLSSRNP